MIENRKEIRHVPVRLSAWSWSALLVAFFAAIQNKKQRLSVVAHAVLILDGLGSPFLLLEKLTASHRRANLIFEPDFHTCLIPHSQVYKLDNLAYRLKNLFRLDCVSSARVDKESACTRKRT